MNSKPDSDPHILARKVLVETDLIVEEGWNILRHLRKSKNVHIHDKEYFFAGAAYMFDAVLSASMSKGSEPTETDLQILDKISVELRRFNNQFNAKVRLK